MELNQILYNSKATHVKNAEQFPINKKKVIFPIISDIGWFRVITNSVQFQ